MACSLGIGPAINLNVFPVNFGREYIIIMIPIDSIVQEIGYLAL